MDLIKGQVHITKILALQVVTILGGSSKLETMNVLYLNLKKKYFDQILQGTKKYEYREVKEFFIKRLQGKNYDFVKFSNGYSKNAPYFYVKYLGYEIVTRKFEITGQTIPCFKIKLGQVQKDLPF